nr:Uncharacterised protein [Raoultella sp. NCTC 9187]
MILVNERWYCETENRDVDGERRTVHVDHSVMSLHGAQRRFNNRAAGVLKLPASGNMRLLADNPFTLNPQSHDRDPLVISQ